MPNPANPQSWNRYAYTLNNPIRYSDPTGHYVDEGCGVGDLCELPKSEPPPPEGDDKDWDPSSLEDIFSHVPLEAFEWPVWMIISSFGNQQGWWSSSNYGPIVFTTSKGTLVIVMPPGTNTSMPRSNSQQGWGMFFSTIGYFSDWGELLTIPTTTPADEDGLSLVDLGITIAASYLSGETYWDEQPYPGLPRMHGLNQDVLVTALDTTLGSSGKYAGGAILGLAGWRLGQVGDAGTTVASILYDSNRLSESIQNYVTVGVTSDFDTGVILLYP